MLALRRAHRELRANDLRVLLDDRKRRVLAYSRGTSPTRSDDDRFVVVLNFSGRRARAVSLPLPAGGCWRDRLSKRYIRGKKPRVDLDPAEGLVLERTTARYCAEGAAFPGYVDYERFCSASTPSG